MRAAAVYGFARDGGNALTAHGVIDRPTEDIDLFTDREHGVAEAASAVEAALAGQATPPKGKTRRRDCPRYSREWATGWPS